MPVNSLLLFLGMSFVNPQPVNIDSPVTVPGSNQGWEQLALTKKDSAYTEEVDTLLYVARDLLDTRYLSRGMSPGGFDCSGFVHYCYQKTLGINLPHSSAAQSKLGQPVKRADARPGDLIFFKGSNANSKMVGHVGIIVSIEENEIIFIHSAVHGGVRYDSSQALYYKKRFVCIRRIL